MNDAAAFDPRHAPKRALIVAHEPDGPGCRVTARLVERGFAVHDHVVTPDMDKPNVANPFPSFADYDLIVLMGSVRSLTNKAEIDSWIYDELDAIRGAAAAGTPMLGICFGGQLLADALGGSVENSPVTEMGWTSIRSASGINPVGPGPWMQWHHDRFTPPADATVLAVNDAANQLFTLGRSAGAQFHPEVDVEHVATWLSDVDDEYLTTHGCDRVTMLDDAKHHDARNAQQCAAFVDWYLDEVAFVADPDRLDTAASVTSA